MPVIFMHIDIDVNTTDCCLILAEMKGCQISVVVVCENWSIRISQFFQSTSVSGS